MAFRVHIENMETGGRTTSRTETLQDALTLTARAIVEHPGCVSGLPDGTCGCRKTITIESNSNRI